MTAKDLAAIVFYNTFTDAIGMDGEQKHDINDTRIIVKTAGTLFDLNPLERYALSKLVDAPSNTEDSYDWTAIYLPNLVANYLSSIGYFSRKDIIVPAFVPCESKGD